MTVGCEEQRAGNPIFEGDYADPEGVARQREEGEWISIIRGEVSLRVGEKDVHLKGAQKTFVPSMTAVRIVESTDPCVLLSVLHK